jgi:hypothetical protein
MSHDMREAGYIAGVSSAFHWTSSQRRNAGDYGAVRSGNPRWSVAFHAYDITVMVTVDARCDITVIA